jgi:DNA-binding NtrC family response regulator
MENVLIVEDHDHLREQLGRFYVDEGYRVSMAACGEEALEKLTQEKFAIVVSDVKMPGIDGFQLTRHIREKAPDTDVILITAFGNIKQAVEAMKLGASDYITKPFQPEAIRLVSAKLIERRRLLQEVRELRERVHDDYKFENILSKSPKMLKVFDLIAGGASDSQPEPQENETVRRHQLRRVSRHSVGERAIRL